MSTIAAQPRVIGRVTPVRSIRTVAPERGRVPAGRATGAQRTMSNGSGGSGVSVSSGSLRLTRRGRVVAVVLGLLLAVAGVMGGRAVADGPREATEVETYAVQSGDTLWSIAQGVAQPGEDVRDVVIQLQRLNELSDGSLLAGQVLLLPVEG